MLRKIPLLFSLFLLFALAAFQPTPRVTATAPQSESSSAPASFTPAEWADVQRQIREVEGPTSTDLLSSEVAKLQADVPFALDQFGWQTVVQGDIAAIPSEYSEIQGAVYIFYRNYLNGVPDGWQFVRRVTASDGVPGDRFSTVALYGDMLAVGADQADISGTVNQGAVYLFARNQGGGNQWGQVAKITASDGAVNDAFGFRIDLFGDMLAVSAPYANVNSIVDQGAIYLFNRNQGGADAWGFVKKVTASDGGANDLFGVTLNLSQDILFAGVPLADISGQQDQGAVYVYYRNDGGADAWGQRTKIVAPDGVAHDSFGWLGDQMDLTDTLVVGASEAEIEGHTDQGAVYIYERNQGGANLWGLVKKIWASDGAEGDRLGSYLTLWQNTLVVGARLADVEGNSDQGAAYVFERNEGGANQWGEIEKLTASDGAAGDQFGRVSMSGNTLVIGARYADVNGETDAGAAYVFSRQGDSWSQIANPTAPTPTSDAWTGFSIAMQGKYLLVGAPTADDAATNAGAAYLFERNQGGADAWQLVKTLTAPSAATDDNFGYSVSLYDDVAVVGARNRSGGNGAVYVFYRNQNGADQWGLRTTLNGSGGEKLGSALSLNEDRLAVGAPQNTSGMGAVYLYERNQGGLDVWGLVKIIASPAAGIQFGYSVSLENITLAVGAPYGDPAAGSDAGLAYIFRRNQGGAENWGQIAVMQAVSGQAGAHFGWSIALSDDTAVVGSPNMDVNANTDQGMAYIFNRNQGSPDGWGQVDTLSDSTGQTLDRFGFSVSVLFDTALVGAPRVTVDGNANRGQVYLFERNQGGLNAWGETTRVSPTSGAAEDRFGISVALGNEFLAAGAINVDFPSAGATNAGAAYVYRWVDGIEPPVAQDDDLLALEDIAQPLYVLDNDSDPEGGLLTIVAVGDPANGIAEIVDGAFIGYLSNPDFNGTEVFTYTIMDVDGLVDSAIITLDVDPINDFPVANDDTTGALQETPVAIPVLDNDYDVDGDPLSISELGMPANGTTVISDTNVIYTPETGFLGTDVFTYTLYDNSLRDTAWVTVTVRAQNQDPVAVDDSASTVMNTEITISILDNDSDPDGDLISISDVGSPSHGLVEVSGAQVIYTPNNGYVGNDSFLYTISDGVGGTDTAQVNVEVRAGNQNPTAEDDSAQTLVDTPMLIDVLSNDSDPDGDTVSISDVTNPSHGVAMIDGDSILYTPAPTYAGTDTFQYTLSDGFGGTDTATVTVEITGGNQAPDAVDDTATTDMNTSVSIYVLDNDTDPDGDTLSISDVSTPAHGLVEIVGDHLVYTPSTGYTGTDTFTYTLSDGLGGTDTATVTVTINDGGPESWEVYLPLVIR